MALFSAQVTHEISNHIKRIGILISALPMFLKPRVAGWWKVGLSIEEIGERLSTLSPAEIHAALAYYHLHREEIESYLEEERAACRTSTPT